MLTIQEKALKKRNPFFFKLEKSNQPKLTENFLKFMTIRTLELRIPL